MYGQCEQMVQTLVSGQAKSTDQPHMPRLQPVLRRHSHKTAPSSSSLPQLQASSSPRQGSAAQPLPHALSNAVVTTGSQPAHSPSTAAEMTEDPSLTVVGSLSMARAPSGGSMATVAGVAVTSLSGDAKDSRDVAVTSSASPRPGSLASLISTMSPKAAAARRQSWGKSSACSSWLIMILPLSPVQNVCSKYSTHVPGVD